MLPNFGKLWTRRQVLRLQLISDRYFVSLSPCVHVCCLCKLSLLGGGDVSRLPYTYRDCIVKRHFHTMCPALCGGIWGFTQAFSLPARESGGMTCYKSGACIQLTFELAVRRKGLVSASCMLRAEAWVCPWWQTLLQ